MVIGERNHVGRGAADELGLAYDKSRREPLDQFLVRLIDKVMNERKIDPILFVDIIEHRSERGRRRRLGDHILGRQVLQDRLAVIEKLGTAARRPR